MENFDLDEPLMELVSGSTRNVFTVRQTVEGIQIFGGIGGGKSSGPALYIANRLLRNGWGGLVLCAKEEETAIWKNYARQTGRSNDLIVLEAGGQHAFNFLQYEAQAGINGMAPTENLVSVLKTVIRAGQEMDSGKSDDAFWEAALDMLIYNVIDLCKLAYGRLSIQLMYDIIQTAPRQDVPLEPDDAKKAFHKAFEAARKNVTTQIDKWIETLSEADRHRLADDDLFEEELTERLPDARLLRFLDQFFMGSFRNLSDKTRSIVDLSSSNFLMRLLREPIYSLFCRHASTFRPEDSLDGKIIIINLSVKQYEKIGRDCQILFKYVWQRAMEKRDVSQNGRPVFIYADESQYFLHAFDASFQATARSSRVATIYITQNLPNYYASMGGQNGEYRLKGFLGTLACKIFAANADVDTNRYASELIGDAFFEDQSESVTVSEHFSQTRGRSLKLERVVRPEQFVSLKTGGPKNNYRVEVYLHRQGDSLMNGQNHLKMVFNQKYQPA